MNCPRCQADNPEGARFCEECGARLEVACPSCGQPVGLGKKFCRSCGATLTAEAGRSPSPEAYTPPHLAEKILTSRSALEGERKQVTVLFCDLANSTGLAERLGPEVMHSLLNGFFELALGEVHRYEGTVNQFLGDGFMALFGAPLAHEDHARRAVLAALGLQGALRKRHADFGLPQGVELSVRMGLNTGLVVVGKIGDNLRMDYTAVGDTTNLAARLQQVAERGTILVSEATRRLVRGYARLEAVGPTHIKGKNEPITAYKVVGLAPGRSPLESREERALSQFVGRERELAALQGLLSQVEGGQGQVVGIVGEPGLGKSRLLHEFRLSLSGKRVTYLEGRCLSYGSTVPYLPVLDIIRNNCGITETDIPEAVADKVRFALQEVGMNPEEGAPYLLHLLGVKECTERLARLDPEVIQTRAVDTLRQMSLRGSRHRPIVFSIEDLHWIDKTSENCLGSLVESVAGAPILFVSTYRPGYRPPWIEKSYATQMALRPLSLQDSLRMVHSVLPREQLPDNLTQVILAKAEGNPFFLEELTRAMVEHGDFRANLPVPDTVQGVIMARIDRLPGPVKRLLQTASVLGRQVPLSHLEAICEGPGDLDPYLRELTRLEFIYHQSEGGEPVYVFRHALTQEVAYESLLTSRRQALHAATGQALERLYADCLEQAYDRLAYHYSKTDEAAKAVEYLTCFARQAARRFAHAEAVTVLQEAVSHAERLPTEERDRRLLDIIPRLVRSLSSLGRFQDALDLLLQQREWVERLHNPLLTGRYYHLLAQTYTFLGDRERTVESARRAVEEAKQCGDVATTGKAFYVLALECFRSGRLHQGVEQSREAISLLERTEERSWLGMAYFVLGMNYGFLGDFEAALEAAAQAYTIGEALGDPRIQAPAAWVTGDIYVMRGEWEAGIEACKRALDLSPHPHTTADALGHLGIAYLEKGDPAQAIPLLEQSVQQWTQFRLPQDQGFFTIFLSEAYFLNGQREKALNLARQALELSRKTKYWQGVGFAQLTLGRIAQARGAIPEAENHLEQALETFASIHARYMVGRTHLELAALAHAQGDREAVTRHLKEARSLFEAVRAPKYVERTERQAVEFGVSLSGKPGW